MVWTEHAARLDAEGGTLHATVTMPEGAGCLGVVILAGSGPVDRNGNVPNLANDCLKHLAHGLAGHGIASLRADKRGVGASTWDGLEEAELRFGAYVRDAAAWAAVLRAWPGIAGVSMVGHSEGALVATLAAGRAGVARLVLLGGAGIPAGPLMERQFSEGGLPQALRAALHDILSSLAAGRMATDVPGPLAPIFRPSVQPYLMSWLPIDPAMALSRVKAPVLVVQGTTDIQVGVADARILAASCPGATLAIIDGMNHILRQAPPDRAANVATYRDPSVPLHPELVPAVSAFLTASA